jgi:hypothetical protein
MYLHDTIAKSRFYFEKVILDANLTELEEEVIAEEADTP